MRLSPAAPSLLIKVVVCLKLDCIVTGCLNTSLDHATETYCCFLSLLLMLTVLHLTWVQHTIHIQLLLSQASATAYSHHYTLAKSCLASWALLLQ